MDGTTLAEARIRLGRTQQDLADALGNRSRRTVATWERDGVPARAVQQVEAVLEQWEHSPKPEPAAQTIPGSAIAAARHALGLSQRELAAELTERLPHGSVAAGTVAAWETGHAPLSREQQLADVLGDAFRFELDRTRSGQPDLPREVWEHEQTAAQQIEAFERGLEEGSLSDRFILGNDSDGEGDRARVIETFSDAELLAELARRLRTRGGGQAS